VTHIRKVSVLRVVLSLIVQFICWIRESWVCSRTISRCFGSIWNGYHRFDRRFRIYEISDFGETIRTYKRLANEEFVDAMALTGRGAPEPYAW
jgi:hypothetical protein